MAATLETSPVLVSLGKKYVLETSSTLKIKCHDRHFRDAVVCKEDGEIMFKMEAKDPFRSWSIRRTLRDTLGNHVFDLRHYKARFKEWVVEDAQGTQLCLIKDGVSGKGSPTSIEARIVTDTGYAVVSMKSNDHAGTNTIFEIDGVVIAELFLVDNNDVLWLDKRGLDRTGWRLRIVEGVDMAIILALAFCRAEITHAWRR